MKKQLLCGTITAMIPVTLISGASFVASATDFLISSVYGPPGGSDPFLGSVTMSGGALLASILIESGAIHGLHKETERDDEQEFMERFGEGYAPDEGMREGLADGSQAGSKPGTDADAPGPVDAP